MQNVFIFSQSQKRLWRSLTLALGLEVLVAFVVLGLTLQHKPTTSSEVIPLSIETLMDTPPDKRVMPEPARKPSVQTITKATIRTPQDVLQPATQQAVPSESPSVQTVRNETAAPAAPAQTPPMTSHTLDPALAYNVKLAAAVQAAFEVPGSAKALAFKGKSRVEFTLHDGVATSIRVIQGSGLGAVDRAAIKAVESATFPMPPVELKNKVGTYQIWVACF
jgi:TonB family protein